MVDIETPEPNDEQPNDAAAATVRKLPRNVKVLGWASLFNDIAGEMVYPLLPQFLIAVLGGNKTWLGIIDGTAESLSSIIKLWSGRRSDRDGGRKGFVVVGYAMAALTRPLAAIISWPWQLFGIRAADRIGKGIRTPPRDALIADSTAPDARGWAFGFHQAMDHVGAAVGPLVAAAFLWFWPNALRQLFLLTLIPGLAVVLLLWMGLRSPKSASTTELGEDHPFWTLRPFDRRFRLYLVALIVFTLGNSSDLFLLARAKDLGVVTWAIPLLWCLFGLAKSAGNMIAGPMVDRVGPRPMILVGWVCYAAVYLAFGLASSAWQAWVLFFAYAVFYALTEPSEKTLVANLAGRENRGLAYGWYNAAIGIATLPASVLFGWLYDTLGATPAFGVGAGMALLAAILLACL